MPYSVKQHLDYNVWANSRLVEMVKPLDEELINRELKSSFPSITKTILHIWDSHVMWLRRIQEEPLSAKPSETFKGSKDELLARFLQSAKEVKAYSESGNREFFEQVISYKTMTGEEYEQSVVNMLFHLVNHATYHRGQIVTMLRELGITNLISTDLIVYLRVKK